MTIDKAKRRKSVARWHRRFAVFVSIWLILLAGSGLLINHANDWGLDSKPLIAPLQQWVYGVETQDVGLCEPITREGIACDELFAQLQLPVGVLLLGARDLFLLDDSGQLVEKISVRQFGLASLQAAFREGSEIYLRGGNKVVQTTPDLANGHVLDSAAAAALNGRQWQEAGETSQEITWERFLLDLHAARFLGPVASLFNDLMAAFILILAISGIWLYAVKGKKYGKESA
jgi:uncharacterized iron-regulated membrane protein